MKQVIRLDSGVHTLHEVTAADKKYIENLYEDVKKTIRKKMTALGIRNNPNTAVSDSLKKFQLRELEKSIDRDLAEIRTSTQAHIIGSMNTISQAVAQSNADWLASMGLNFSFSVASVPPDVVANLVSGKVYADNWQFSKRIWGDYRSSKGDVSNIVARGIAENKSAFEIAQDLEKYVSPSAAKPWDWSKVYPGCKKKIDYNAQRLARTLSAHAYQQSVIETAKRNPFTTRVEWHSAMVERTCPICEARNGQIYELGKVPMDHPNGLCCIYPVLDKSLEDISNILADWVNGEGDADMNGKIDKYISYLGYDPGKVAAYSSVYYNMTPNIISQHLSQALTNSSNSGIMKASTKAPAKSLSLSNLQEFDEWQANYYACNSGASFLRNDNPNIYLYSGGAYDAINALERGGKQLAKAKRCYGNKLSDYVGVGDLISEELSKFKLPEPIYVKRVVGDVDFITGASSSIEDMKKSIGKIYTEKGFTSTTICNDATLPFGGTSNTKTVLDIYVPTNTRGAYIYKISDSPAEFEFLIDKNTNFKIIDAGERDVIDKFTGKTIKERFMKLEVIPDD